MHAHCFQIESGWQVLGLCDPAALLTPSILVLASLKLSTCLLGPALSGGLKLSFWCFPKNQRLSRTALGGPHSGSVIAT